MEAASTSETSVNLHQTTRRNIPEDRRLHTRLRENLESQPLNEFLHYRLFSAAGPHTTDPAVVAD
jgi:hypothetical protein